MVPRADWKYLRCIDESAMRYPQLFPNERISDCISKVRQKKARYRPVTKDSTKRTFSLPAHLYQI